MPPMPGMPMRPRRRMTWRERMMHRFGMDTTAQMQVQGARTIPAWLTGKAVAFFFVAMFACWGVYGYVPPLDLWLTASISVLLFFLGAKAMAGSWKNEKEKQFVKYIYVTGLIVRLIWVFYCYFYFNMEHYGYIHGDDADTGWYMRYAHDLALALKGESKNSIYYVINDMYGSEMGDIGYPMWLALGYVIWGDGGDVFVPMVVKCIVGAYCAICIYRVAKRHFGEGTARMAAIFVAINPNMIYWCGTMFKEVEMVFLVCLAVDNLDRVLSSGQKFTFKNLLPGLLAALSLIFFRVALGLIFFVAFFAHIVMASQRVMSLGKKIIAGVLVGAILLVSMGDRIRTQSQQLLDAAQSDRQDTNMEWRANREGGNNFAKYAGAAVFAPLIFTIPFPTFNQAEQSQILQVQLSGGSYIKNIMSFFVIMVMFMMLISGEWRRHVFILAYTVGYHMVLVMSEFAQSGRFHMPVWPMLMLFAAYGVQIAKTNARIRKWFPMVLVLEVAICLAWNWFKLKGRGMI